MIERINYLIAITKTIIDTSKLEIDGKVVKKLDEILNYIVTIPKDDYDISQYRFYGKYFKENSNLDKKYIPLTKIQTVDKCDKTNRHDSNTLHNKEKFFKAYGHKMLYRCSMRELLTCLNHCYKTCCTYTLDLNNKISESHVLATRNEYLISLYVLGNYWFDGIPRKIRKDFSIELSKATFIDLIGIIFARLKDIVVYLKQLKLHLLTDLMIFYHFHEIYLHLEKILNSKYEQKKLAKDHKLSYARIVSY